ncbi:tetratricopeptide repeat protein [Streptomyces sp. G3]|uniref:tetratricopeptide repeat protein n=1 Tax=Streptomyces sp. G3 TaxID=690144 RepID=UPI00202F828D|nr:tetratricopeptide repeat protein [Streptomyces sp. G3]MCM1943587.1 tetratricopeptide repeat protein [Streptomyces sp. G3]
MSEESAGSRQREPAVFTQAIEAGSRGQVNAVQHGDQYNYIYRNEPPYRVEPFLLTEPARAPGFARVPSRLLAARYRIVPFRQRPELDVLESWREDRSPGLSVRLLHAEGGQGKTRLAIEFATRSAQAGWSVALARHRSEVASAGGGDEHLTVRAPGLVLIVDYAERWPLEDLIALVRQHRDAARDRLRILLLARPAGTWWQSLAHQLSKLDIFDVGAVKLRALPNTPEGRAEMYSAARDRFAEIFGITDSAGVALPGDLDGPAFGLTLTVHMRALVDVDAAARGWTSPAGSDQAALSSYLLDREHDHWRSSHDQGRGPVRVTEQTMRRTVYVATLTRSLDAADAAAALVRTGVTDSKTAADHILHDHAYCYPPENPARVLEPLTPDRLGEDFLALTLPGKEEQFRYYATDPWSTTAPGLLLAPAGNDADPTPFTRQALTVLIETAHRWPHLTTEHLQPLLRRQPELALTAGSAAITRLTELADIDLAVLERIESKLPDVSHFDLDVGAAALAQRLTAHRLAATTDPATRAHLLHDLAFRTSNAGLHTTALPPIEEAVAIRRPLAQADPATHRPGLAASLTILGNVLADLGRRQEALAASKEAAELYRHLVRTDSVARLPDLALALTNLAARLHQSGRGHEAIAPAQEAVSIRRRLAEADPGAYLPHLALSLSNLGGHFTEVGRLHEALTPVEEAVELYRQLAATSPAAYLRPFAASLHNLGNSLSDLGRRREALAPSEEAVAIGRRLVEANPAAYTPSLALALTLLSYRYAEGGRNREAVAPSEEAVHLYRQLVGAGFAAAHQAGLAKALAALSVRLRNVGRRAEAKALAEEAVGLYRQLAEADPFVHRADLAYTLSNGLGILPVDRVREGVDLYRRLVEADPDRYASRFGQSLINLSMGLANAGRTAESIAPAEEAVALNRRLAADDPTAHLPGLALALTILGHRLAKSGRPAQALPPAKEAADIYRRLARTDANPALHRDCLVLALTDVGTRLRELGRLTEADPWTAEAAKIRSSRPDTANTHNDVDVRPGRSV